MQLRPGRVTRVAVSVRILAQRFAFLMLITTAVALMLLGKADNVFVERLRVAITDLSAPVLAVISHPIDAVNDGLQRIDDLVALHEENKRFRLENERLRGWAAIARGLEQENRQLRALTNFVDESVVANVATARVIADVSGPYVRTVLLDVGARNGVQKGHAVVNAEGLVGRIVDVGERSARVLLLTDLNSRVPIIVDETRDHAILAGDNSEQGRLIFIAAGGRVQPGDRVVTSGHGGLFPPGLPVGVVSSMSDGVPRVQPYVKWHRLEYLRVLALRRPDIGEELAEPIPNQQW